MDILLTGVERTQLKRLYSLYNNNNINIVSVQKNYKKKLNSIWYKLKKKK